MIVAMGMRAHMVAVSGDAPAQMATWSADQVSDLLRGPTAVGIDKSWEAAFPLIGSIAGTGMMLTDDVVPVGDDLGYGPAMFVDADQVAAISARLAAADDHVVEAHWDSVDNPFLLAGNYDEPDGKEFGLYGYRATADLFAAAAEGGQGVLFAIM